ncbi:MAG: PilZ domain-containing protein [bacterium]|jgi:c-di-GMP-binding flagellar brake protein YcgR|nr:PilZ domain-containing protein [bacterium]
MPLYYRGALNRSKRGSLNSRGRRDLKGIEGRLVDVSGGGLKFTCDEAPEVSSLVEMSFELPDSGEASIHCAGRVLRVKEKETGWSVAIEFTHIREADRERTIQSVFQMSMRQSRGDKLQEAPSN